jgi:protein-disulfide isomerase
MIEEKHNKKNKTVRAAVIGALTCLFITGAYYSNSEWDRIEKYVKTKTQNNETDTIISGIEDKYNGLKVFEVDRGVAKGIIALQTNKGVLYTNESFDVVIKGDVFSLASGSNISEKYNKLNAELIKKKQLSINNELGRKLFSDHGVESQKEPQQAPESTVSSVNSDATVNAEEQARLAEALSSRIKELNELREKNDAMNNSMGFLSYEHPATARQNQSLKQAPQAKQEEKKANKDHVDVSQVEISDAFIYYKDNKITKVGYNSDGTALSLEEKNKQVEKIIKGVKEKGDAWSIKYPAKGVEKSSIFVFTDPTCGYCKKLHGSLDELNKNGISVYYLFYPRALALGMDDFQSKDTIRKMQTIWCSEDSKRAMDAVYGGGFVNPSNNVNMCNDKFVNSKRGQFPAFEQYLLGNIMGINGTPLIVKENGEMITGFTSADLLMRNLSN